jgi:prolyl-tRNA editing enzyme YbaK/EbsC (Cys-tRNA(Pro) deacylase)
MHPRAEEFSRRVTTEYGIDVDVREFPEGTKTARTAAEAIGCPVERIASAIVLSSDEGLVVAVTSGADRVSTATIAARLDVAEVSMADADEIKSTLGWSIGGVPPFGYETDVPTFVDETLLEFEAVWGAAGTPAAMFPIDPETIVDLTDGRIADVKQ